MSRAFDERALLDRVDNDLEFLAETVGMLKTDGPALMAEVRRSLAAGDAAALGRAGHALKGMVSNFCAAEAQAGALEVERLGKAADLAAAGAVVERLAGEVDRLLGELEAFVAAGGRCAS
jgi:protein-histidine pros-kinase